MEHSPKPQPSSITRLSCQSHLVELPADDNSLPQTAAPAGEPRNVGLQVVEAWLSNKLHPSCCSLLLGC